MNVANEIYLPAPIMTIGRRHFWRRRAIRLYVAAMAGEPEPAPQPDDEFLLNSLELRVMLGGVSDMWIWRRTRRADTANINGRSTQVTSVAQ